MLGSMLRLRYGILEGEGVRTQTRPPDSKSGPSFNHTKGLLPSPLFKSDRPHSKSDRHLLCSPRQPNPEPPFLHLSNKITAPLRGKTSRRTGLPCSPQMPNDRMSLHDYWNVSSAHGLLFLKSFVCGYVSATLRRRMNTQEVISFHLSITH